MGPFAGVAPTGNWVTAAGVVIWRLRDGQVVEDWNAFDQWGIVAQIDPAIHARGNPRAHVLQEN
jgi:predicted ester cyclase